MSLRRRRTSGTADHRARVPAARRGSGGAHALTQAGALGDPYGSGTRTIWWVYGVGPVKVEFDHAGGTGAPVTTSVLQSTSLTPAATPTDIDYFPLTQGLTQRYRWTNAKHLKQPEVEQVAIQASLNGTARFTVTSVSGPIKRIGSYGYTTRVSGVTNLWARRRRRRSRSSRRSARRRAACRSGDTSSRRST